MANSGNNPKNTSRIILIIAGILVLTSLGYFATQYFSEKSIRKQAQVEVEELTGEIEDLEERIIGLDIMLEDQGVALETKNQEFIETQERLLQVQAQLKQLRASESENQERLTELEARLNKFVQLVAKRERELAVLQRENDLLNGQVDSLIVNETELRGENRSLQQQRDAAQQELDQTREIAGALNIQDLRIYNYNARRDKATEGIEFRRRAMKDLKLCFTVMANPLADAGARDIYLVFENPDGSINTNDQSGQFTFSGRPREFTASSSLNYRNLAEEVCITFLRPEDFEYQRGPQYLSLYADGNLIGQGSFMIK